MKKFISFVMAAAMVASLVPATAFAKGEPKATVKVIDALDMTKIDAKSGKYIINEAQNEFEVPELQMTITSADYRETEDGSEPTTEVTVTLDNATFVQKNAGVAPLAGVSGAGSWGDFVEIDRSYNGNETNFLAGAPNGSGNVLVKNGERDVYVSDLKEYTGFEAAKALMDSTKMNTPKTITFTDASLSTTTGKVLLAKSGENDIAIYDADANTWESGYLADGVAVLGKLLDGWSFKTALDGAAFTIPDYTGSPKAFDTIATNASTLTFTSSQQAQELATNFGWTRGTYESSTVGSTAVLTGVKNVSEDQVTFVFTGKFQKDDVIIIDLFSKLDKTGEGRGATVSVDSKLLDGSVDDLTYVSVKKRGISATTRKVGSVAEEEIMNLETDIKISSNIGDFDADQWFEIKLSKGFEFSKFMRTDRTGVVAGNGYTISQADIDGNVARIKFDTGSAVDQDTIVIDAENIEIEATSAKSGATCTMTISAMSKEWDSPNQEWDTFSPANENVFSATTSVEVMKVVDYKVVLSVDEDEDIPEIYSGVNVDNYGITDDSDHMSLEVTAKETFPGAWSMRKGFNFELPEHVYVTDVKAVDTDNFYWNQGDVEVNDIEAAFWNAYREGSHLNFEFEKRVFDDVDNNLRDKECAEMTFQLELVADPGFEGDVVLKLTGELVDEQEVTIAKFVKPYEVKAEQNDLKIDYRYTEIPTTITITEAEKGLWRKNEAKFYFSIEKEITFDSDPTFEIDSNSGLEIKDDKAVDGTIQFTVKSESDEPATVTIKDMDLFMQRNIPAGPYDLKINSSLATVYEGEILFAPDDLPKAVVGDNSGIDGLGSVAYWKGTGTTPFHPADCQHTGVKADSFVGCVCDYSDTVKEAFVNVITAGREVDDASFTTKVVVPVGESYMVAGEKQIELDVPAYINAAGYTMLPIRAVATALGISNNNVLWDQPTKTVTILYGQRIITMTQGQKVVYVNGSAIPASAAVENTNSRTFLPMRDLATALGVTDIQWDQATRTATLNGNQK